MKNELKPSMTFFWVTAICCGITAIYRLRFVDIISQEQLRLWISLWIAVPTISYLCGILFNHCLNSLLHKDLSLWVSSFIRGIIIALGSGVLSAAFAVMAYEMIYMAPIADGTFASHMTRGFVLGLYASPIYMLAAAIHHKISN